MDSTKSLREELSSPADTIIDADIWYQDSHELRDLAETMVDQHPRFAWLVVDIWLTKHNQQLLDK